MTDSEYDDLARRYEQQIERVHPPRVTSRRMCPCLDFCSWCGWAGTAVTYYDYRGPSLESLKYSTYDRS